MKKFSFYIFLIAFAFFPLLFPSLINAQDASSNCVYTKIGTQSGDTPTMPPGCIQTSTAGGSGGSPTTNSTSSLAKFALEIATSALKNCPNGLVDLSTYSCLDNNFPKDVPYPDKAKTRMEASVTGYGIYECVGYVNTVTAGIDPNGGIFFADRQNAPADYIGNNQGGYSFVSVQDIKDGKANFQEGDMPIWDSNLAGSGGYGHIAVVTQKLDSQNFIISQANYDGRGSVDTRPAILTEADLAGFLHYNGN